MSFASIGRSTTQNQSYFRLNMSFRTSAILTTSLATAAAFVAPVPTRVVTSLRSTIEEPPVEPSPATPETPVVPVVPAINGWVPDDSKAVWGLPGAIAPTGLFDPAGFCQVGM